MNSTWSPFAVIARCETESKLETLVRLGSVFTILLPPEYKFLVNFTKLFSIILIDMANDGDFNIYDDLDDAFNEPLDKDIAEKKAKEEEKSAATKELLQKLETLEGQNKTLKEKNSQILKNMSLLTMTCLSEVNR